MIPNMVGFKFEQVDVNWMIDISGKNVEHVRTKFLNEDIDEEGIDTFFINASKILSNCPNPNIQSPQKKTGLVVGKVQSGKTSNFISLIALSFDNNYDVVVVFGGTKINLVEQNKSRISNYFSGNDNVIVLDTENNKSLINESTIKNFVSSDKKVIIVSLKSSKKIDFLRDGILSKNSFLSNKPILLIDDEGDEYSLNTLVKKNKRSSTYNSINLLLTSLLRYSFISITATPQANLLIKNIDILSPDFVVLVSPGKGYYGVSDFHDPDNGFCINISKQETSIFDTGIPPSYSEAISRFLVAAAINNIRMGKREKFSMLVHPTWLIDDLKIVKDKTESLILNWISHIENPRDISSLVVINLLKNALNLYKNEGIKLPNEQLVITECISLLRLCGVHLVTGQNQLLDNDRIFDCNIYIGGQMLGRGLTIKGLGITYIIRRPIGDSNIDTTQQRARWFGYKEQIIDLCRIYATKDIISDFNKIRIHEENLWSMISKSSSSSFKSIRRLFYVGDGMVPTRNSVASFRTTKFSGWSFEDRFLVDKIQQESNIKLIDDFFKQYESNIEKFETGKDSYHVLLKNLDFSLIYSRLIEKYCFPENARLDFTYLQEIYNQLVRKNILCNIVLMRSGDDSVHEIGDDNIIPYYFVGRRPQGVPLDQCTYKGDNNFYSEENITLQVHFIVNKYDKSQKNPTFALYIPSAISNFISNIIEREE